GGPQGPGGVGATGQPRPAHRRGGPHGQGGGGRDRRPGPAGLHGHRRHGERGVAHREREQAAGDGGAAERGDVRAAVAGGAGAAGRRGGPARGEGQGQGREAAAARGASAVRGESDDGGAVMKGLLVSLCVVALPLRLGAQVFPKATKEGQEAAAKLLAACEMAGAIKFVTDPHSKADRIVVADEAKLKEAARQHVKRFTPAVRDVLLRLHDDPGIVALLLKMGQQAKDERALAFGHFFSARLLTQRLQYREARQSYEQAAPLFERLKLPG